VEDFGSVLKNVEGGFSILKKLVEDVDFVEGVFSSVLKKFVEGWFPSIFEKVVFMVL
jgi:hypothetical protein